MGSLGPDLAPRRYETVKALLRVKSAVMVHGLVNVGQAALEMVLMPLRFALSLLPVSVTLPPSACVPVMSFVHEMMPKTVTSSEHLKGASRLTENEAVLVGVELVDLHVMVPLQMMPILKVPLVVMNLQSVNLSNLSDADRPSAAVVPLRSTLAHVKVSSLPASVDA